MEKSLPVIIDPDKEPSLQEDLTRERTYQEKAKLYTFIIQSEDGTAFLEKVGKGLIDDEKEGVNKGIERVRALMPYMRYEWERGFVSKWYEYYIKKGFDKDKALELANEKLNEEQYGIKARDLFFIFLPESSGRVFAVSRAGAKGLYQFMPKTAKEYGLKTNKADYRTDPLRSAYAAGKMFASLMIKGYDILTSTVAYNGGEKRTFFKKRYEDYFTELKRKCRVKGMKAINVENLEYPGRFVATIAYLQQKRPDIYGIEPLKFRILRVKFPSELFKAYRVKRGDTLIRIARSYARNPRPLLYLLKLMYGRRIRAGQTIMVPLLTGKALVSKVESLVRERLKSLSIPESKIDALVSLNDAQIWSGFLGRYPAVLIIPETIPELKGAKIKEVRKEKQKEKPVEKTEKEKIKPEAFKSTKTKMVYSEEGYTIIYHRVLPSQTLYGIAANYGVSIRAIRRWNNLKSNRIYVGQVLIIKLAGRWERVGTVKRGETLFGVKVKYGRRAKAAVLGGSSIILPGQPVIRKAPLVPKVKLTKHRNENVVYKANTTYINHVVKEGQTLFSIAKNYGVSVEDIIRWNGVTPRLLRPGMVLTIKLKGRYVLLGKVKKGDTITKIKRRYRSYKVFVLGYGWPLGRNLKSGMLIYGKK